jgi:hypothetical protein
MIVAIGLAVALLVCCCPCTGCPDYDAAWATHPEHRGHLVVFEINSTNHPSAPNPFGRDLMTETLSDEEEEKDLDSFSSFDSSGAHELLATRPQETRLYSPLDHDCSSQQLHSSVELRC